MKQCIILVFEKGFPETLIYWKILYGMRMRDEFIAHRVSYWP